MKQLRNKVQLIGHLGADPIVKELESGRKVANWNLATSESYRKGDGEIVKETQWHRVIAWGKLAEIAEKYFIKGQEICIEGKLSSREYKDKEGVTRYITEVIANEVLMLGKKQAEAN